MPAVRAQARGDHAGRGEPAVARARLKHDRPRPIAEQDAGRAVAPIQDARKGLGADHQRAPVRAGTQEFLRRHDRIDEAGADRLQVESGALDDPKFGLDLGGDRGKRVVGRRCGDDDEIDVCRLEPAAAQRRLSRIDRQRRRGFAGARHIALTDAGALHDPFVRRVDPRRQFGVRDDALRQRSADTAHAGADRGGRPRRGTFPVPGGAGDGRSAEGIQGS